VLKLNFGSEYLACCGVDLGVDNLAINMDVGSQQLWRKLNGEKSNSYEITTKHNLSFAHNKKQK